MDIYIESTALYVADNGIHKTDEGYMIVTNKNDFLSEGVVFEFFNSIKPYEPVYGIVKEVMENDNHNVLYVRIDPMHIETFTIELDKSIIIHGKL